MLIGIVLNSMEEARELERREAIRDRAGARVRGAPIDPEAHAHVLERIVILRRALDDLKLELAMEKRAGGGSAADLSLRIAQPGPLGT